MQHQAELAGDESPVVCAAALNQAQEVLSRLKIGHGEQVRDARVEARGRRGCELRSCSGAGWKKRSSAPLGT